MKVKIGDKIYSDREQPIMVILTQRDKENIANMAKEDTKYCSYPGGDSIVIEAWMKNVITIHYLFRILQDVFSPPKAGPNGIMARAKRREELRSTREVYLIDGTRVDV